MNAVMKCLEMTEQLVDAARNAWDDNREGPIGEIENLLEERERLLPAIKPPFTSEEMAAGRRLIELNSQLDCLLSDRKKEIQIDMRQTSRTAASAHRYANPYESVQQIDGIFYDKRK